MANRMMVILWKYLKCLRRRAIIFTALFLLQVLYTLENIRFKIKELELNWIELNWIELNFLCKRTIWRTKNHLIYHYLRCHHKNGTIVFTMSSDEPDFSAPLCFFLPKLNHLNELLFLGRPVFHVVTNLFGWIFTRTSMWRFNYLDV